MEFLLIISFEECWSTVNFNKKKPSSHNSGC